jgi:hypothetical protein
MLRAATVIDAPADRVWQVIAYEFDRIGDWATAITSSALSSRRTGRWRGRWPGGYARAGLSLVPEVTETIVAFDQDTGA